MLQGSRIAVVVPAYNEARLIGRTLRGVPDFVDDVWVIDDGSTDQTSRRARDVGDPRVRVVRRHRNVGVGAAISRGYERAFAAGADAVAVMGGDAQMDPADLAALLAPIVSGDADYAKGNRLCHGDLRCMPWSRRVGNRLLSWLTRRATGLDIGDSQCGYTALNRRALGAVPQGGLWSGYGYPNDMLGWLAASRMRIRDVGVRPVYGDEQSGIRLRHALIVIPYLLVRVGLRRLKMRNGRPVAGAASARSLISSG